MTLEAYADRGARALVLLHEREMRTFLETWRRAAARGLTPPASEDPDYVSLDSILLHVLACARGYMVWTCRVLELPDPEIREAPSVADIAEEAEAYLEHVLERWRLALAGLEPGRLDRSHALSGWGVDYAVDSMLEHAVMHPVRHAFQLGEWLEQG